MEGLRSTVRDRIGVQVIRNLPEAKNITLKVELMHQEQSRRNYEDYKIAELMQHITVLIQELTLKIE